MQIGSLLAIRVRAWSGAVEYNAFDQGHLGGFLDIDGAKSRTTTTQHVSVQYFKVWKGRTY